MEYLIIISTFLILLVILFFLNKYYRNNRRIRSEYLIPLYNNSNELDEAAMSELDQPIINELDQPIINELDQTMNNVLGLPIKNNTTKNCLADHIEYISTSEDECAICLETFENKKIIQYECLHKYHPECIAQWSNERKNNIVCPECGI